MGKIEQVVDRAMSQERKRRHEAEKARLMVSPLIGDVIGLDSADEIYRHALKENGISTGSSNTAGMQAMIQMLLNTKSGSSTAMPAMATDTMPETGSVLSGIPTPRKL
ncbi:hypothetical protein [Acetobacter sp. P1H12_c]|uniref:hypothetical protein n=1 Tax=Acetobacter sp. P1H12_c TaxID=2762621 RepID=UPI001C05BA80|nr:hypothetical protein [Acetobacter sp. P1H12_c]